MNESIFFERWFDESYELDLPEIINQIIKYSTNDSFPHPSFISFQFYFSINQAVLLATIKSFNRTDWIEIEGFEIEGSLQVEADLQTQLFRWMIFKRFCLKSNQKDNVFIIKSFKFTCPIIELLYESYNMSH